MAATLGEGKQIKPWLKFDFALHPVYAEDMRSYIYIYIYIYIYTHEL